LNKPFSNLNIERTNRSYNLISEIQNSRILFGYGFGNEGFFIRISSDKNLDWLNNYSRILISFGFFGLLMFLLFYMNLYRKVLFSKNIIAITLLSVFIIESFGTANFFAFTSVPSLFFVLNFSTLRVSDGKTLLYI
jgi:hypothetical protein